MMEALQLRTVDMDYRNHLQAFLNFSVQAKRKAGKNKEKPVYSTFRKFYDYGRELDKARKKKKPDKRFAGIGRILKRGGFGGGEL